MVLRMKKLLRYILPCVLLAACQPKFEMVPPGGNTQAPEFSENWFVTMDGAGTKSGKDWGNAISFSRFMSMITDASSSYTNSAFHIREGEYLVTAKDAYKSLSCDVACIRGGYSKDLTYSDLSLCNPDLYPTVFSGDVNKSGAADDGDGVFAYVTGGSIRFDNITFKHFYLSKTAANALGGKGSAVFGVNGSVQNTVLECRNCLFEDNVNAVNDNAGREGGPCAFVSEGYFRAKDCIFRSNKANSRGGAIRTSGTYSALFLDRCLFTGNRIDGSYGSAIQGSSGTICMNNCTLVGNVGKGSTLNGGCAFLIVSSTVVDDAEPNGTENAAFRCESTAEANSTVINSVFSNSKASGIGLIVNGGSSMLTSCGFNLFKSIQSNSTTCPNPLASSDTVLDVVLTGAVDGRIWKWDVAQVWSNLREFAIVDDVFDAASAFNPAAYSMTAVGKGFTAWVGASSFLKDGRGSVRGDEKFQPGSYDPNID